MRFTWTLISSVGATLSALLAQSASTGQEATHRTLTDWPMYRHDEAGTGYSPMAQIDVRNVANPVRVWTYRLQGDAAPAATGRGGPGGANSEATPSVVNGVTYLPAVNRNADPFTYQAKNGKQYVAVVATDTAAVYALS